MSADVLPAIIAPIMHERWRLDEMFWEPAKDCDVGIIRVGSAGSKNGKCGEENELDLLWLCFL